MKALAVAAVGAFIGGCGDNQPPAAGSGPSPACSLRPAALAPVCTAPGFCWASPTPGPLGRLTAVTSADCDFLIVDSSLSPQPIYTLGSADTLGQTSTPATLPLTGILAFSATEMWAITDAGGYSGPTGGTKHRPPSQALHYDGTQWQSTSVSESTLTAIWGSSPTDVWIAVAGDLETAVTPRLEHWDGHALTPVALPDATAPAAGASLAPDDVWICAGGTASHYDGNGWTMNAANVTRCTAMQVIAGQVFLTGDRSVMRWDGASWSAVYTDPDPDVTLTSIWGATADDVVFVGPRSYLAHWDGHALTQLAGQAIDPEGWQAVWGIDGTVWAVDASGEAMVSSGQGWTRSHACFADCLQGVRITGSSPSDVWLLDGATDLYYMHFDGTSWSLARVAVTPDPGPGTLADVYVASPSDVWAVGYTDFAGAGIFHLDSTGWVSVPAPSLSRTSEAGIWASGDDVWVTDGGSLYRRQAGQWIAIDTSAVGPVGGRIFGRSSTDLYFAGGAGLVHWNGSGLQRIDTHAITSIGGDAVRLWVTGPRGYVALDDGSGLRPLDPGTTDDLVGAYFYAPGAQIDRGWVAGHPTTYVGPETFLEYRP